MWGLPPEYKGAEVKEITLVVRHRNGHEETVIYPLEGGGGYVMYELRGADHREAGGIASYKAELVVDSEVVEEWRHQVWVEKIVPKNMIPQTATVSPRAS